MCFIIIKHKRYFMEDRNKEIIMGRKTFFIAPDASMLPESYLEDYLSHGYETYIIGDDHLCPLKKKVEFIIELFEDSILFFYIDAAISGIDWRLYIRDLQNKYGTRTLIGVIYSKRNSEVEKKQLEKYYLYDVGIQCGCIELEYQRTKNFSLIDKVMFANQASGRRKTVRAICEATSEINFEYKKNHYKGRVMDISLNHFSCVFETSCPIPQYEKVHNVLLLVDGMRVRSDALLMMTRQTSTSLLYIFMFIKSDGTAGLDPEMYGKISQKIYQMVTTKTKALMRQVFSVAAKQVEDNRLSTDAIISGALSAF